MIERSSMAIFSFLVIQSESLDAEAFKFSYTLPSKFTSDSNRVERSCLTLSSAYSAAKRPYRSLFNSSQPSFNFKRNCSSCKLSIRVAFSKAISVRSSVIVKRNLYTAIYL
jgi:hypothetical protein